MRSGGFLVWDFDGTLAMRPGAWTGTLCEVVTRERPDLGVTPEAVRPHLQRGFRWHTPDIVRGACSKDQWWDSSGRIGAEKPHPRAFETVFAEYPGAREGWMIGDSWRAGVQGARADGMRSILVRSTHPEATVRCETLEEIGPIVEGM